MRERRGEPLKFCARGDAATYWRVDIGGQSIQNAPKPGLRPVVLPRRILVQGRKLIDSASGAALQLHGLNVYLDYLRFDDMALMRQLLPSANFVRLVGVFWHDTRDVAECSCCTDDEARLLCTCVLRS